MVLDSSGDKWIYNQSQASDHTEVTMTQQIVECVPNFSEGRDVTVIRAIEAALVAVQDVHLLDRHIDEDHNRTVLTFIGPPSAVSQAAFAAIEVASELINLDHHQGEHPRIGATDVVPFVPISGVTMDECVELARSLGQRVGDELGIPVYLYEQAATRPDRVNLADVRRGEYEALKGAISSDPDRAPDYGPNCLSPAGATVIGARPPLIAFNVYLTTDDVSIAKKIARTIRYSSGGLPYVKALGLLVEGRAQVSMNLTDFTQTPIAKVVEAIRLEADGMGVAIHHSELVGLIPQAALVDAAQRHLQLDSFDPNQILEKRMYAVLSERPSFLDQLASGTPTPGGGSAAAYSGAMAAALVAMVARLTMGKKKYAAYESRMSEITDQAEKHRQSFENSVLRDAQAFNQVMAAYRKPKETDPEKKERAEAIERALHHASAIPLEVAQRAVEILELAAEVAETGNLNALSDVACGAAMAKASLAAASLNVKVNAKSVTDAETAKRWLKDLKALDAKVNSIEARIQSSLVDRAELET
jgi:glutamate formiminotransferase/formiminotetrahydrofolate cyclodeaminase